MIKKILRFYNNGFDWDGYNNIGKRRSLVYDNL